MNPFPFIDIHTHRIQTSSEAVRVVNLYPGNDIPAFKGKNFYSLGLHPWKLKTNKENNSDLTMMEEALEFDHVIFAGECGLDKLSGSDFDEQKRVFAAQVIMAEEFQKPLIIHCVRAYNEIIEMYNSNPPSVPWIFHNYTGSPEMTAQLLDKNFLFSFGKILSRTNSKAVESFKRLPMNKIFFETDEYRGPVSDIYAMAAEIKKLPVEELKRAVLNNFNRLENVSFEV